MQLDTKLKDLTNVYTLQRRHSDTVYLTSSDLFSAAVETAGACKRRDASALMDRRDDKCKAFFSIEFDTEINE